MTVRASSERLRTARSMSSAAAFLSRSISTLSRWRPMSLAAGSLGVTVSSPPVMGLCRSRR
jgi:hypothetical protein